MFTNLGRIINQQGRTDAEKKTRIITQGSSRSRTSQQITTWTKLRLFNSNIKSVQLYGAESYKTTKRSLPEEDIHQQLPAQDPGLTLSATKTCGRKPTSQQPKKKSEEDGGGTNFIKSYPATHDKPLLEIHWAKERSSKKLPAKGSEDKYQTDGLQV